MNAIRSIVHPTDFSDLSAAAFAHALRIALAARSKLHLLHVRALADIEAEAIRFAISHYRGQMSEVARRLHIGRSTLYRKLDSLARDAEMSGTKAPAL